MISVNPNPLPDLSTKKILLFSGLTDPIVCRTQTENLYRLFQETISNIILKVRSSGYI
jgi:predicted esterase